MKRILCAALALSLLVPTVASAHGWDGHGGWRGHRHHDGGGDAALGFGLGILMLGIIAAAHDNDRDRAYDDRGYGPPPSGRAYDGGDRTDGAYPGDSDAGPGYGRDDRGPGGDYDEGPDGEDGDR